MVKKAPNHLLTWQAIERAYAEGYRFFDFGRASTENEGLMRHKKMWGAEAIDLPYAYHPRVHGVTASEGKGFMYKLFVQLWKRIPDALANKIGSAIYPYVG